MTKINAWWNQDYGNDGSMVDTSQPFMQGVGPLAPGQGGYGGSEWFSGGQGTGFNPIAQSGTDWSGRLGNISQGVGAFKSLADIYGMFKQLGMQKKAFRFAQEGTKRNFNAQAQAYNTQQTDKYAGKAANARLNNRDMGTLADWEKSRNIQEWT